MAHASCSSHFSAECHQEQKIGPTGEGGHVIPSFLIDNLEEFRQTSLTGKFVSLSILPRYQSESLWNHMRWNHMR